MYIYEYNLIGYPFLEILVFVICFDSNGYCISVFAFLQRITDIQIFLFESKWITNRIKIYGYFS